MKVTLQRTSRNDVEVAPEAGHIWKPEIGTSKTDRSHSAWSPQHSHSNPTMTRRHTTLSVPVRGLGPDFFPDHSIRPQVSGKRFSPQVSCAKCATAHKRWLWLVGTATRGLVGRATSCRQVWMALAYMMRQVSNVTNSFRHRNPAASTN